VRANVAVAAIVRKGGTMPEFQGVTHIALTVTDLRRSVPWYSRLFTRTPSPRPADHAFGVKLPTCDVGT
jgi:hypothetical protein